MPTVKVFGDFRKNRWWYEVHERPEELQPMLCPATAHHVFLSTGLLSN